MKMKCEDVKPLINNQDEKENVSNDNNIMNYVKVDDEQNIKTWQIKPSNNRDNGGDGECRWIHSKCINISIKR